MSWVITTYSMEFKRHYSEAPKRNVAGGIHQQQEVIEFKVIKNGKESLSGRRPDRQGTGKRERGITINTLSVGTKPKITTHYDCRVPRSFTAR